MSSDIDESILYDIVKKVLHIDISLDNVSFLKIKKFYAKNLNLNSIFCRIF
jgi:hypothetical protein